MAESAPKLSQYGPAFAWLLTRGVSASRLGGIFGTTADNVRVIAFRARHASAPASVNAASLGEPVRPELADRLGIRPDPDDVVRTPARLRKLEWLREEIERISVGHAAGYRFLEGAKALRKLLPYVGYAGDARRIALSGLLHERIAWFLVHCGRCESASEQAQVAQGLWQGACHERPLKDNAEGFVQAVLIDSNAHLMMRSPREAWSILDVAHAAAESAGIDIGSEPLRQRGVALFQLREDERAAQQFRHAAQAMERLGEAQKPAQLLMTGVRHISLLGTPDPDAGGVAQAAEEAFGTESLEYAMALNWVAAARLITGSDAAIHQALYLLQSAPAPAPQFGHQTTIRRLLSVTPELGLDARLRAAWVRRALYENALKSR